MASEPFLPYGRQTVDQSDIDAVTSVLQSDFLTTGPMVERFERGLCDATGAARAVAVNSGTAALHAAYFAAGIGPGDEVITSAMTFASTANAALHLGAKVRFVDVDPDTGLIDPDRIEPAITERTRAIVAIDYTGHPADYDRINAIANRHGLPVIADAAHSLGAADRGRRVGTLADLTATSFHPVKPITTGEGGAVLTHDADAAERAAAFRTHGITRDREQLSRDGGPWFYEMHNLGLNYRLPDLNCALGVSQLKKLDRFLSRRREIAKRYDTGLADVDGLTLPIVREGVEPGWHLYVVRLPDAAARRGFFDAMRDHQIGVQVHYIPVHTHPYFQRLGYQSGSLPRTEAFYDRCVSLPVFPGMTDADVDRVIDRCRSVVQNL